MNEITFPSTFEVARLKRQFTFAELAKLTGLSTRELRRIEKGEVQPTEQTVAAISSATQFPLDFFKSKDIELPKQTSFRKLKSTSLRLQQASKATAALSQRLSSWLVENYELPEMQIPDLSRYEPELAALMLRQEWRLEDRPIKNMLHLLEAKGVRVFALTHDTAKIDAFATWVNDEPYVYLNTFKSAERSRFDAAHELAHLCLHREREECDEIEREADIFASAFLMPKSDILRHRRAPTLANLLELKARWGVSLAALVHRYADLGLIPADRVKWMYIELSRRGYLKKEPDPMPFEISSVWSQVLQHRWRERKSLGALANEVNLDLLDIEELLFLRRGTGAESNIAGDDRQSAPPPAKTALRLHK